MLIIQFLLILVQIFNSQSINNGELNEEDIINFGFNYEYKFIQMTEAHYADKHPANGKIFVINEIINSNSPYDIIVFLDSDAWIQNHEQLHQLLTRLSESPNIHGAFSRDPYLSRNTYINSGSFILKVNDFIRNLYARIIDKYNTDTLCYKSWPYDQYYISNLIFENKDNFMIFIPHILNTPYGEILRHNWWKNQKMFRDLYDLLDKYRPLVNPPAFDFVTNKDEKTYPNPNERDNEYY
jgi:hypothetical protein